MSDPAPTQQVTPILDAALLPPPAAALWKELTGLVDDRRFGAEPVTPGVEPAPLHKRAWELSDQLLEKAPGFAIHRLLRATMLRDAYRLPEAEREALNAVALAPGAAHPHQLLKQILAFRDSLEEGAAVHAQCAQHFQLGPYYDATLYMTGDLRHRYPEEAIAAFQQHLASHPDSLPVALALGELLIDLERYDEAEYILGRLTEMFPEAPEVHSLYGSLLAERGEVGAAFESFQRALHYDPMHTRARINAARALAELGDAKRGLDLLREAAEDHQGDADYNMLRGDLAAMLGLNDEAAQAYTRALAADPDDPEDVQEIESALRSLGAWSDSNVRLQYLLAERALDEGEGLRAIKHLSNVKNAGVDTRELYLRMAEAHNAMGLLDDPLNFLVLAKSKKRRTYDTHGVEDPSDARLDLIMLSLMIAAGRYSPQEATEKLLPFMDSKKYEREPESFFVVLATAWQEVGDLDRAAQALGEAIARDPMNLAAWVDMGGVLAARGEVSGAVQALERVWHAGGKSAALARQLTEGYKAMGAVKWAAHYAEEA
ncbi:MAG TPA: tetratricopeptide repeat protein, partial [bacterium]|nr:tetratricopeptide repeat protein [bacterium]